MKKYLNSVEEVVKALKEGVKVRDEECNSYFQIVNGFIAEFTKGDNNIINVNSSIYFIEGKDRFYTEEPEPLKFEVNKLYKTSKNKKAFLYKIVKDADFMYYFSSEDGCFTTDENGVFYNFGLPTDNKIIGYWEEEK